MFSFFISGYIFTDKRTFFFIQERGLTFEFQFSVVCDSTGLKSRFHHCNVFLHQMKNVLKT